MMNKFIKALTLILVSSFIYTTVHANCLDGTDYSPRNDAFWGDSRYWMLVNNYLLMTSLRTSDLETLCRIEKDNGAILSTYYSLDGSPIPQSAAAFFYLSEMGLAILRSDNFSDAEDFLNGTEETRNFYKNTYTKYKNVPNERGMGRLVQTQTRIESQVEIADRNTSNSINAGVSLAFNLNAAYAYFLAVRSEIHEKYRGSQSRSDQSMAFKVYRYLHTQITIEDHPVYGTYIKWPYSEARSPGHADDLSHAGIGARSLAFGSKYNYAWVYWSNMLFGNERMASKFFESPPTHMDFEGTLDLSKYGKLDYWRLPYPN